MNTVCFHKANSLINNEDILLSLEEEPKPTKTSENKALLSVLLFSVVIIWTLYGNIVTFYPPYTVTKHPSITDTMTGVVISMFEGTILLSSPVISLLLSRVGKKRFIIIGTIIMIIASAGFGLTVYIQNDTLFFIASLLLRSAQGLGEATSSTAIFSIIA